MIESLLFRVRCLEETTSTNDEIKRALEAGEPEGLIVRARRQTGGYGRQGRGWVSPEGGMYMSLLLRPHVEVSTLPTLSLVVSLAVRRAVLSLSLVHQDGILVKWPNDLVVPFDCESTESIRETYRKLSGISLEVHAHGVCVGIGMNVYQGENAAPVGGGNLPVYLSELGYRRSLDEVSQTVMNEFAPLYLTWQDKGIMPLLDEYRSCMALMGRQVCMLDQTGSVLAEGDVEGVDEVGRLMVRETSGSIRLLSSGEAHLR